MPRGGTIATGTTKFRGDENTFMISSDRIDPALVSAHLRQANPHTTGSIATSRIPSSINVHLSGIATLNEDPDNSVWCARQTSG
jgi:hypothetical protein